MVRQSVFLDYDFLIPRVWFAGFMDGEIRFKISGRAAALIVSVINRDPEFINQTKSYLPFFFNMYMNNNITL